MQQRLPAQSKRPFSRRRAPSTVSGSQSSNGASVTLRESSHELLAKTQVSPATAKARTEQAAIPVPPDGVPLRTGDWIGTAYRLEERLGGGSMGQVFAAFDDVLERRVAIKLIRANLHTVAFRKRFMLEARAMATVSHPNVLTIHALGEQESGPFIVMELVEGQTLDAWMAVHSKHIDLDVTLGILDQICLGVGAIHAAGTLHRDVKPGNILLHQNLRVRVSDLGLAVSIQEGSQVRELVGTPGYIAPEIQFGRGDAAGATPQSDLYSLGCVAFELLTGKPPFLANDNVTLATMHATAHVPLPSRIRPELPTAFDDVLTTALAKKPSERHESVEAFRRALHEARNASLKPRRILVAEDDPDFRELIQVVLERDFPGSDIECVPNGRKALEAFDRDPASVVVMDLHMPELDGFGATTLLRSRPRARTVPIIIMTALGGPKDWETLSALGADRFLVKPVNMHDFVSTIRRALRERSSRTPLSALPSSG